MGMKKISFLFALIFFIGLCTACSVNFPYESLIYPDGVDILMRVTPDDADVWLNDRLIGSAYEFSTPRSALRLASRQNELVFKKDGYGDEKVDLSSYPGRNVTLKIDLRPDGERLPVRLVDRSVADQKSDRAYVAASETPPPLPTEEKLETAAPRFLAAVALTVTPAETAVYIDGKFWGLAPEAGKIENLRLKPGKYAVEAFKPGYLVYKKEVTVPKQEKFALDIALQKN
jgi:hypothetical protein